jgi:hypothetical protein
MERLTKELEAEFRESARLEAEIRENLGGAWVWRMRSLFHH